MNRELIERIDDYMRSDDGLFKTAMPSYEVRVSASFLTAIKAEIERLQLANETLSALNVEYLERVKAPPKQEHVAYTPMANGELYELFSVRPTHSDIFTSECRELEAEVARRMKEQGAL